MSNYLIDDPLVNKCIILCKNESVNSVCIYCNSGFTRLICAYHFRYYEYICTKCTSRLIEINPFLMEKTTNIIVEYIGGVFGLFIKK